MAIGVAQHTLHWSGTASCFSNKRRTQPCFHPALSDFKHTCNLSVAAGKTTSRCLPDGLRRALPGLLNAEASAALAPAWGAHGVCGSAGGCGFDVTRPFFADLGLPCVFPCGQQADALAVIALVQKLQGVPDATCSRQDDPGMSGEAQA